MSCLIILALAGGSPDPPQQQTEFESFDQIVEAFAPEVQTGTLLVTQGDCLAVRIYTQSPYTHVAAVVVRNGQPVVYDAAKGTGVRCLPLAKYLRTLEQDEIHIFQPQESLSQGRAGKFEAWLDSQLGKPYAVKHHLTGERGDGVHCAEYVTDALMACGMLKARQPARVSPASLVAGITKHGVYSTARTMRVETPPSPPADAESGWCATVWNDTKSCTSDCWRKVRGWCVCR